MTAERSMPVSPWRRTVAAAGVLLCCVSAVSTAAEEAVPLVADHAAIDVHTHVASQVLADFFTGGGVPYFGAEDLVAKLDEARVGKAVILGAGYFGKPVGFADEGNMAPENDFVAAEVARFPDRLIGFCGINPLFPSALTEVDRCLDLPGMVGVKLHLEASGVDLMVPEEAAALSAVLDRVEARDAPVLIHVSGPTGMPLEGVGLSVLGGILGAHPTLRVAHAHCAGNDDDAIELWIKAGDRGFDLSRSFVDVSACLGFYADAPLSQREMIVWRLRKWGIERVLFGSDYFAFKGDTPRETLDFLTSYPFTQAEIDTILSNDGSAWLGTDAVGVTSIEGGAQGRSLALTVWYPARGGVPTDVGANAVFVGASGGRDAPLPDGRLPLVLISNGGLRSAADSGAWLSSGLARAGFLAAEVNGPRPAGPADAVDEIWRRPDDLSHALDVLLGDPDWANRIDASRVYAVGLALGGTAAVAVAGGEMEAAEYAGACDGELHGPDCTWFASANVSLAGVVEAELARPHRDSRIKAAVAIDPEYLGTFSAESLANLEVPVLVLSLGDSGEASPVTATGPTPVLITGAIASDGFPTCTPAGPAILADEGGDPELCGSGTSERGRVHAAIHDRIVAFLSHASLSQAGSLPADRLQSILDEAVAAGVPGAVLRVETADGEAWTGVAGVTAIGGASVAPNDLFRLFSITKTVTAATAFTLIDEGRLGLDDPIGAWLDPGLIADLPNSGDVTVRHLIAQTSGFRDYQDDRFIGMIRENFERVWMPAELVAHAADGAAVAPPGDGPSYYSNTNYALLGLIIEKASGMRLADAIRARVLKPLGATNTHSWAETGRPEPVSGYFEEDGSLIDVSAIDLSVFWGSGDLLSTAEDTSKLLRGILAGDLLSAESRALMTEDFRPLVGRPVEYGYGTFRLPAFTPPPVGHSGEGPGGDALALWWPDDGTIVVILTNLDNGAHVTTLEAVAEAIAK